MSAESIAVLDACVLIPMPLADTLLRFAEAPELYRPRWSADIIEEVSRNLVAKLGLTREQALRREAQMRSVFPEAWVSDYESLVPDMRVHVKDRHVLAAAVRCGAESIVTFNEKDFGVEVLMAFGIKREGPSAFLSRLYASAPLVARQKLEAQAMSTDRNLDQLLRNLDASVPAFVRNFRERENL